MSDAMLYTPPGCVLYLDLRKVDGNKVYDYSGHGNHGTVYGARLNQELPCKGLEFDGEDDYVHVPNTDVLKIYDVITVEGLIRIDELNRRNIVYSDWDWPADRANVILFVESTNVVRFGIADKDQNSDFVYSVTKLEAMKWYHLVGVFDGDFLYMYVNGMLDASKDTSLTNIYGEGDMKLIGRYFDYYHRGIITLLRIYNRALTADEVKKCFEDIQRRILRRIVAARDVSVR